MMNNTPLTHIAPEIFRKRLLIEGFFGVEVTAETVRDEDKAVDRVKQSFKMEQMESAIF